MLYVEGANSGKMLAHGTGIQEKMFGTVALDPDGDMAMTGQRYPITQIGILNLTSGLIEVAERGREVRRVRGQVFQGRQDQRPRLHLHPGRTIPVPRKNFLFNVARIFVDDQLNIPVRYEAYDWPKAPAGSRN